MLPEMDDKDVDIEDVAEKTLSAGDCYQKYWMDLYQRERIQDIIATKC
jgi:hypothetical protein